MKAIIPIAGTSSILLSSSISQPRALLPIAGKEILSYNIDSLLKHDITDFIFIVGIYGDKIKSFISKHYPDINAVFITQIDTKGIGHAVYLTQEYIENNEQIIVVVGDSIIDIDSRLINSDYDTIAIKKVDNPSDYGVVHILDNYVTEIFEKPKFPTSNYAICGLFKFKNSTPLFDTLSKMVKDDIRTDGKIQLTDALNYLINDNSVIKYHFVDQWYNLSKITSIVEANSNILTSTGTDIKPTSKVINSSIIEPVSICEGAIISNSIIGPNVTIGKNTSIDKSIMANGVVGCYCEIDSIQLTGFVIGNNSNIKSSFKSIFVENNSNIIL